MLHAFKQHIPQPLLQAYHFILGYLAALVYGFPSDKLVVIGVTGTNGKSSTVNFIAQILTEMGETCGYTSTAGFNIAGRDVENAMKMTMPGRFALQKMLAEMVRAGCGYAIVETSSQGLAQFRHVGVNYDMAVFTNLTPEHIEAHGGFENYKKAKGLLFQHLTKRGRKSFKGEKREKVIVVNADDEHASYYASFKADKHIAYGWEKELGEGYYAQESEDGSHVFVNGETVSWKLKARFEQLNVLAAIAAVAGSGFSLRDVLRASEMIKPLAGRFELIDEGQPFTVVVDYAYEPYALRALYDSVAKMQPKRVIGVHGSAGGGRDKARRPIIGKMAAEHEAFVVVTNEDPYDEPPRSIIEEVAQGAVEAGKTEGKDLFLIDDRYEGIAKACALAQAGDVVVITGKGSEPVMAVAGGRKVAWDDRVAARKVLASMGYDRSRT